MTGTTVSEWSPTTGLIPDMYTCFSGVSAFKGSYELKEIDGEMYKFNKRR